MAGRTVRGKLNCVVFAPKETDDRRQEHSQGAYRWENDIQLIPFLHDRSIDIHEGRPLQRYGADAWLVVVNFFLIHKFRGLEIGGCGTYGKTTLGGSNDMVKGKAWLKAGTGADQDRQSW